MKTYTKAVSATLAGALAVGMVPAMALADEAMELQSYESASAFTNGEFTAMTWNGTGNDVSGLTSYGQAYTGAAIALVPSQVTLVDGVTVVNFTANSTTDDFDVYYLNAAGAKVENPTAIGKYTLVVEAIAGTYKGGKLTQDFNITGKDLNGAGFFEIDPTQPDTIVNDTDLTFDNAPAEIAFYLGNDILVEGKDYTVKYYKTGVEDPAVAAGADSITNADSYFAVLTGKGDYAGVTEQVSNIVIKQFDISAANTTVLINDVVTAQLPKKVTTINGKADLVDFFEITSWTPSGVDMGAIGSYTCTVAPTAAALASGNFVVDSTGKAVVDTDATFAKVTAYATPMLGTSTLASSYTWDKSAAATNPFSLAAISVLGANNAVLTKGTNYTVAVTSETVQDPENSLNNNVAGVYTVTIDINPNTVNYAVGGVFTTTVTITNGTVDANTSVYAYYDNEIVTSVEKVYDGQALLPISANLKPSATATNLVTCDVKYYDAAGKEIALGNIVNAGTYKAVISANGYTIQNDTINIVVKPKVITGLAYTQASDLKTINGKQALKFEKGKTYEVGTADASAVTVRPWIDSPTGDKANGKYDAGEWVARAALENPAIVLKLDGKVVANNTVTKPGIYEVSLAYADADVAANYVLPEPLELIVSEETTFIDVPTSHWAYANIESAFAKGYVNGKMANGKLTGLFGPSELLTRGQVVCIAYNIMGGEGVEADNTTGAWVDVESMYSDVRNDAYYAEALAWATTRGVVSGDKGKDTFRPNDSISVQETVAIYANIAKALGWDMSYGADAFKGIKDADSVSNWAKDVMAWAAENGYVGQGGTLNAKGTIARDRAVVIADRIFAVDPA